MHVGVGRVEREEGTDETDVEEMPDGAWHPFQEPWSLLFKALLEAMGAENEKRELLNVLHELAFLVFTSDRKGLRILSCSLYGSGVR